MKIILFGSTGMIDRAVLLESIDSPKVNEIIIVNRNPSQDKHPKVQEILHQDFADLSSIKQAFKGADACFYCLGVSAAGMSEKDYTKISYDFPMEAARALYETNPGATFTFVSGQGTDSTEKGSMMWARVKGKTENDLLKMGFKNAIMFRPGAIIPERGIESRTPSYRTMYKYLTWLLKILKSVAPNSMNTTTEIAKAMINCVNHPPQANIVNPKMIVDLAQ